ncbi:hypothetical protein B0H13DRAFT_1935057 [Mycena leptocephala]|nr:hypothetical protein B0H13DRAFT_1935057 [Mycena leptocephala]
MRTKDKTTPRLSFIKAVNVFAKFLEDGGYLDSQTSDTQFFGFSDSQTTGYVSRCPSSPQYAEESELPDTYPDMGNNQLAYPDLVTGTELTNAEALSELLPDPEFMMPADQILLHEADYSPSDTNFPILKCWGAEGDHSQALEPFIRKKLGNPLTPIERCYSEDFMRVCRQTAFSGQRNSDRPPNAAEIKVLSVLSRLAECIPLVARFTMEGRWDEVKIVVDNASMDRQ